MGAKEGRLCLHTGTFCVHACIVFVMSKKKIQYVQPDFLALNSAFIVSYEAVSEFNMSAPPPFLFLM